MADSHYAPYGDHNPQYVVERTSAVAGFLTHVGAKAIVVACNTATTVAVTTLRESCELPVVGIEPGIKPAVERSAVQRIVVLATRRTIESEAVGALRRRFGDRAKIILQACPGLAELVERGEIYSDETRSLLEQYTAPVRENNADVVVLGCTHFAFLKPQIHAILGDGVDIIEPSEAVARQLKQRLSVAGIENTWQKQGNSEFFTSSQQPDAVAAIVAKLLGEHVTVAHMECAY